MSLMDKIKAKFSGPSWATMRNALFEDLSGGQVYTRNKTLINSALIEHGYKARAQKMRDCRPSNKCRNPYCDNCQRDLFSGQRKRFKENLIDPYKNDEQKARENLFFVTILHELIPFEQPDDQILRFPMQKISDALTEARKQFKSVRRSFNDQIKFLGAFELEAVNGLLVNLHPVKGQVLAQMNGVDVNMDRDVDMAVGLSEKFILVHSHFMVDLSGMDIKKETGERPVDRLSAKLKQIWSSKKQVDVSPLYKDKAVSKSLNCLSDYPLKFPIKYYFRFNHMSVENDVVIEGKLHNLIRSHETDVMAEMVNGVPKIGLKALYIGLGISKAS